MKKDIPESSKQLYSNTIWSTTPYTSHGNQSARHVPKRNVHTTSQTIDTTAVSSELSQLHLSSAKNVWESSIVGGNKGNLENIYNVTCHSNYAQNAKISSKIGNANIPVYSGWKNSKSSSNAMCLNKEMTVQIPTFVARTEMQDRWIDEDGGSRSTIFPNDSMHQGNLTVPISTIQPSASSAFSKYHQFTPPRPISTAPTNTNVLFTPPTAISSNRAIAYPTYIGPSPKLQTNSTSGSSSRNKKNEYMKTDNPKSVTPKSSRRGHHTPALFCQPIHNQPPQSKSSQVIVSPVSSPSYSMDKSSSWTTHSRRNVYQSSSYEQSKYSFLPPPSSKLLSRATTFSTDTTTAQLNSPSRLKAARPQSFRDDPQKRVRVKTELCENYMMKKFCKFGAKCNYAHGKHELKFTKLKERHDAGMVDANTYRTKPCLVWISTGSCPFEDRCSSMHDPRVVGDYKWWLPHCELQVHQIPTNVHVDSFNHQELSLLHKGNPFGMDFESVSTWTDFYRKVCNMDSVGNRMDPSFPHISHDVGKNSWLSNTQQNGLDNSLLLLTEVQKLAISLKMRGEPYDHQLEREKYHPSHIIFDELCMIVQKRAFCIMTEDEEVSTNENTTSGKMMTYSANTHNYGVREICLQEYSSECNNHIMVHEIMFGPPYNPKDRHPSLWFNINDSDIERCTEQQMRRNKRTKRQLSSRQQAAQAKTKQLCYADAVKRIQVHCDSSSDTSRRLPPKSFDDKHPNVEQPFYLWRPHDHDAYDFITEVYTYRLTVLKAVSSSRLKGGNDSAIRDNSCTTAATIALILKEEILLKEKFQSLKNHFQLSHWPVNKSRIEMNDETPVPPTDCKYILPPNNDKFQGLWSSFLRTTDKDSHPGEKTGSCLPVFQALKKSPQSQNKTISLRSLPLLKKDTVANSSYSSMTESERCWRSLLLHDTGNKDDICVTDWKDVKTFYESRKTSNDSNVFL